MFSKIKSLWNGIKNWFHRSETILIARLETISGIVLGALAAMNWDMLLSVVDKSQALWIAGVTFLHGVVLELARKRNATDL